MRPFRATRPLRPALLGWSVGPWSGTWTGHIVQYFRVLGCRSSTSRTKCRQHLLNPTSKCWVFIAGSPPNLTKLVKLCQLGATARYSSGSSGRSSGGRKKDPTLLYGAGWEGGAEDVPVAVWWDFENCNVPQGIEVYKVGVNIVSGLRLSGFKGPVSISAYGDTLQLSRSTQEALAFTGIRLHHVPSGGKDSSDRALLVDLILWTFEHPPPVHLFLISGDRDFSNALHRLRLRNYNILLACPPGTTVSPALLGAATHVWQWNSLVRGEGLLQVISPDGSYGGGFHSRHGGPRPYTPSYSPVSRGYDANGHSAEGGDMAATQMQSRTGEGCSVPLPRRPDLSPVSPSQSSQKQTLRDTAQASFASEDGVAESSRAKPVLRQPPKKVLQQFRCLLMSHPKGMMLADLQNYIREGKVNFEKDFYGHGKVLPFLSSIPEIVQLERVLMKDNKSWSYNLFLSQKSLKNGTEGSQTAETLGVQTPSCVQAGEWIPATPLASSQPSLQTEIERQSPASQIKPEKLDSPASLPSLHRPADHVEDEVSSANGLRQAGQPTAHIYEELEARHSQSDSDPNNFGNDHKGYSQADGVSSDFPTSVSESNYKTSNLSQKGTSLPTFLGALVDALRHWQTKRRVGEGPNVPQQGHANLNEMNNRVVPPDNYDTSSRSTQFSPVQSHLKSSDTSSGPVRGEVEVDGVSYANGIAEAGLKEGSRGVFQEDAGEVLSTDKQLLSKRMYGGSEVLARDLVSVRQVNSLESELSQSGGLEGTSNTASSVVEEDRRPAWKKWLFGPVSKASSTSAVEFKASPEGEQVFQSDAVTPCLGSKEAEIDSELSKDSLTSSGESVSTQPTPTSPRADTTDEKLSWGHSFVIRQESNSHGTRSMKIWEELEEYVNSADGTLLLSNATKLTEAVNLIRTTGPLQFRCLDLNQISAVVGPLAQAKGITWECLFEAVNTDGSTSDLKEQSTQVLGTGAAGHAAEKPVHGSGSSVQKKEKVDEIARHKTSLEAGYQSSGQVAFQEKYGPSSTVSTTHRDKEDTLAVISEDTPGIWHQYSEASVSNFTPAASTNEAKHPSLKEFEEWVLRVVNSAFKRSARISKVGYNLSLVKPEFEKEFCVRLDPKFYGFSRVQDLVASVPSVRLSKPRIDQCTIHLLKVDAEVSEKANPTLDEQVGQTIFGTESQYWPKMYHDCKALVRELMLENPEGVPGIRLKPQFDSRFNYPLDHKRVGYQRMSDLLRLMPDVVSVNGNLLVPSEEFLMSLKKEAKSGKRAIQNVELGAESEDHRDNELFSEARSQSGENWSEIDKEANGASSTGGIRGELPEDGRLSSAHHACGPTGPEKHSSRRDVLDDFGLSSEDESDSGVETSEVESQVDEFWSFDGDVSQKDLERTVFSDTSNERETFGSTRSPSTDNDFLAEIDELLLEDHHVEKWLEENRPRENESDVLSADPESENVKEDHRLSLDNHLYEDWAEQLLEEESQESTMAHIGEQTTEPNGSDFYLDEETPEVVRSRGGEEQAPVTTTAGEVRKNFEQEIPASVSGMTSREELASVTNVDEQTEEELNSKSLERMEIQQGKVEPLRLQEESFQADKPGVQGTDESVVTGTEGTSNASPRERDVFFHTPLVESASSAEDNALDSSAQSLHQNKIKIHDLITAENAEDCSSKNGDSVREGDSTGGLSSPEVGTKKSIWRRLFK